MNAILVPTDFSKVSRNAIQYAAELAKRTKAKLVLMHVYHVPIVPSESITIVSSWEEVEKDSLASLKKIAKSLQLKYGKELTVECKCEMGFAVDEIIKESANEKNIDLIVMGIHGAGYVGEKLIGSNATEMTKRASCPVLIVNEQSKFKSIKKIVLAYDYKKIPDKSILNPIKEFAKIFKSQVYVLNVESEVKKTPSLKKATTGIAIDQNLEGVNHSFHFIENKDTIIGINEFVESKKADLIVIIPHKHKFWESIFKESNTKRLAFHTSIPMLALHE